MNRTACLALTFLLPALASVGCSAALDFDDVSDLPCPCLPEYVCLPASNRCVLKGSVDPFKSCDLNTQNPDDLCRDGNHCIEINDQGARCLPRCTATTYSTPEAGDRVAAECPQGSACFPTPTGGGVCDNSICDDLANNCPGVNGECIRFNGAGVCFSSCRIFVDDACTGAAICHPIGNTTTNACIPAGTRGLGEMCDDIETCAQTSGETTPRPMICDRPMASTEAVRRCWPPCAGAQDCLASETCTPSRSMSADFIGICQ